jgi:hypothetical protein
LLLLPAVGDNAAMLAFFPGPAETAIYAAILLLVFLTARVLIRSFKRH